MKTKLKHGDVIHILTDKDAKPYKHGGVVTTTGCGMLTYSVRDRWMTNKMAEKRHPRAPHCKNCVKRSSE